MLAFAPLAILIILFSLSWILSLIEFTFKVIDKTIKLVIKFISIIIKTFLKPFRKNNINNKYPDHEAQDEIRRQAS